MNTITLEEHFVTGSFLKATNSYSSDPAAGFAEVHAKLLDLGPGRIAAMDESNIGLQVLSLAAIGVDDLPAAEQTAVLHDVNDELAAAVQAHPDRFAGFCTPGMKQPAAAVKEIERSITQLGFKGVYVNGTSDGKFLDAPDFLPVLETIAALNVPLYLHPAPPPKAVAEVYFAGLPGPIGHLLSIAGWGWHAEMGLHLLRLIASGTLDRLPTLQVIVGHMGEGVPYALARSSAILSGPAKLQRTVAETLKQQVYITSSGYFSRPPFDCCRTIVGLDHMLYSVDYPFSPNTKGTDFLATLDLSEEDTAAFTYGNAQKLLKLQ